jgi:hypothetical protein
MNPITFRQLLDYEIRSSWWAKYISWTLFQDLTCRYFVWKVERKYKRYRASLDEKKRVLERKNHSLEV